MAELKPDTIVIRTTDPALISRAMEIARRDPVQFISLPPFSVEPDWYVLSIDTKNGHGTVAAVIEMVRVKKVHQ